MTAWSPEYFARRQARRLAEERAMGPFRARASKIIERIDWQPGDYGHDYYEVFRDRIANLLRFQPDDDLVARKGGIDEVRAILEFRRWREQQRLFASDDIPF